MTVNGTEVTVMDGDGGIAMEVMEVMVNVT